MRRDKMREGGDEEVVGGKLSLLVQSYGECSGPVWTRRVFVCLCVSSTFWRSLAATRKLLRCHISFSIYIIQSTWHQQMAFKKSTLRS